MFTSRAEFRTLLRQDNADLRLTELSYRLGLASQERMDRVLLKKKEVEDIKGVLSEVALEPEEVNPYFEKINSAQINERQKAAKILLRPSVSLPDLIKHSSKLVEQIDGYNSESIEQAEIQVKYQVYIDKEKDLVVRMRQLEDLEIPEHFDYQRIISLGAEAREKLNRVKPKTLGQASRISGINPSDVQILMVFMGR
jgi:tRNA uridine 5-carboxymethylaminomethyl modification enzyme